MFKVWSETDERGNEYIKKKSKYHIFGIPSLSLISLFCFPHACVNSFYNKARWITRNGPKNMAFKWGVFGQE